MLSLLPPSSTGASEAFFCQPRLSKQQQVGPMEILSLRLPRGLESHTCRQVEPGQRLPQNWEGFGLKLHTANPTPESPKPFMAGSSINHEGVVADKDRARRSQRSRRGGNPAMKKANSAMALSEQTQDTVDSASPLLRSLSQLGRCGSQPDGCGTIVGAESRFWSQACGRVFDGHPSSAPTAALMALWRPARASREAPASD